MWKIHWKLKLLFHGRLAGLFKTTFLNNNSQIPGLARWLWVNLQSFVCSSVTFKWNIQLKYDYSFPLSHRFSPSCPLMHLHIVMRWSQHSNTRLWSHRMPAPCVHFPLFVSPQHCTHGGLGCFLQANAARYVSNYKSDAGLSTLSAGNHSHHDLWYQGPRSQVWKPTRNTKLFTFCGYKSDKYG